MKGKNLQAMLAECFQMGELFRKEENEETTEEVIGKDVLRDLNQGEFEEPPLVLLLSDIEALKELTAPMALPRVRLRALYILLTLYLPGDSSGSDFGSVAI